MEDALTGAAQALGVTPLSADEQVTLLDCARQVAHQGQRRHAPLSTFLLGLAVAGAPDRPAAVEAAVSRLLATLGQGPPSTPPGPPAG